MWGHLLCGDTSYVGTPPMWGHLLCGDTFAEVSPDQVIEVNYLSRNEHAEKPFVMIYSPHK